jgi:hypothetical protein
VGFSRLELEVQPTFGIGLDSRPAVEIADERIELRIGEQINRRARGLPSQPLSNQCSQSGKTGELVTLRHSGDLGFRGLVGLAKHILGGGPINESQQQ